MSTQVESEFQVESDPYSELDAQTRRDLNELLAQGYLVDSFHFGGHSFMLRTLFAGEEWAASKIVIPYMGSLREPQAFMAATVGLALTAYDNDPHFHIRNAELLTHAQQRMDLVSRWSQILIDECYRHYNVLDQRRNTALRATENLSSASRQASSPIADFSTGEDTSLNGIDLGSP